MKLLLLTTCFIFFSYVLLAQTCTSPGQNPSTAFPVCGTSTFTQSSVPICGGTQVPAPTCTNYPLTDVNPFWYKFTCFQSGTLGFKITPHTNSEDYDWQLFDITNHNSSEVYSNINLVVSCNWSGEGGPTGASNAGTQLFVCEGFGKPLWSKMPNIIQGHEYLLLVSHFTQTQSGYDLSFGGGTAIITDSTKPRLKSAEASCGGEIVRIKLNKKMKCSSIAGNGSDFFIMPGNIPVARSTGYNCVSGFDTDSIELQLASFLAPGSYTVNIKEGSDANTILDYCDNAIQISDNVNFNVSPLAPTPMDSLVPLNCKPQTLQLIFKKPILCSSVAADGSDFIISGSYPIIISGATGNCTNPGTGSKEIIINLSQPVYQGGSFSLTLRTGTDGNTIFDECGQETPSGSFLAFEVRDTVNADFSFEKYYGCSADTVKFFHSGNNGITEWVWDLDEGKKSTQQNPQAFYQIFNQKNVQLIVNNGFCSDTSSQIIVLDNFLKADFSVFEDNCPNEPVTFTGSSQGSIVAYNWDFGDGGNSALESPSHTYSAPGNTMIYAVRYTVTDNLGCQNTIQKPIKVYSSCYLAVPNAFTPNSDGKNDFLYPLNAIKAEKLDFKVFNRWGQLVFQTNNWKRGWDGNFKGSQQPSGVYVWFLFFEDRDTKQTRQLKGSAVLIR